MVDTTGDLIEGMRDMRIRNALLITALRKLGGGALVVSHGDVYDSAKFDVKITQRRSELVVQLVDAPGARGSGAHNSSTREDTAEQ